MAKDKQNKKKMSAKVFTAIVAPLLAILLAFSIALSVITTSTYDLVLRDIFGETEFHLASKADDVDANYYTRAVSDSQQLQQAEQAYTRQAGAEGFVLLKNDAGNGKGLPVAAGSKLSLFSASSVDLLAGGTGSGVSTISSDMRTALTEQGFTVNESLWKFYSDNHENYKRGDGAMYYGFAEDWSIREAPIDAIPQEAKDEAQGTTPIFFFSRTGGDTCRSIADVLSGKINPSGHLVDTFAYDAFSSPAMQNMGEIMMVNGGQDVGAAVFYDEGIYVGYKYYETRYFDKVLNQGNAGDYDYATTVQYPFGFGLSYTAFQWSDFAMSPMDENGNIQLTVKVTNTGAVAGREVVQVYLKPFQICVEDRGAQTVTVQEYKDGAYTEKQAQIPAVMAVMTSFSRIGCTWAGGNYQLITKILREEWGCDGIVLTDYDNGGYMDTEQCIRAGGDLKLTGYYTDAELDINNPASQYYARQAVKHILYTTVNSNAMNGIVHGISVGKLPFANYYFILIAEAVLAAALIVWGTVAIVKRWKLEKKAKQTK